MRPSKGLQKLLENFIFRDRRLESHPKVVATHVYFASGESYLDLVATVSKNRPEFEGFRVPIDGSLTGLAVKKKEVLVVPDIPSDERLFTFSFLEGVRPKSFVVIPIGTASNMIGALTLASTDKDFFRPEDTGRLQLLSALIAFTHLQSGRRTANTEEANRIGQALSGIRAELGLTQDELAYRGGFSRIALSQWERGRWPPSMRPIYQWCTALGLVAEDDEPQVSFLDVTPQLLMLLRDNPDELRNLSPERFEQVIAERIDRMGYDVQLTGATTRRDGGIDLIAVPKIKTVGSFLMAAQVKHHRTGRTTGRPEVDRMLAWKDSPFRVGVMVTNTTFSQDAKWLADQASNKAFLRLRDFEDLKRWLRDQFGSEFDWREIPDVISLAPGITVPVPKGRLVNARGIWRLSGVKVMNNYPEDDQ
jgi:transcriptional regulator with XRE-family HTH domain